MGGFREMFEAYGADYHSTMARFMGNEAMYMKFLDMLFKDDNLEKLGEALEKQDYEEAFSAAHTLKGVVGNMADTSFSRGLRCCGASACGNSVCGLWGTVSDRSNRVFAGGRA